MEKTKKVYRSRISVLLNVFVLALFIPVCLNINHISYEGIIFFGGIVLILTGIRYEILDGKLYLNLMWFIQYGSVNVSEIISVERSYNPLSSPAGSLKRLRIKFAGNSFGWLISPVREKEFIEALKTINPDIRVNILEKKGIWRIWDWDI